MVSSSGYSVSSPDAWVTFEHHKELLLIQIEHEKLQHQLDVNKQIEVETFRQQTEKATQLWIVTRRGCTQDLFSKTSNLLDKD